MTRSRRANETPHQSAKTSSVNVQRSLEEKSPDQSSASDTRMPGRPAPSAISTTRRSCVSHSSNLRPIDFTGCVSVSSRREGWPYRARLEMAGRRGSQSESLKPPVQRAATEAKRLRRMAHVAPVAGERLLDQEPFHFFEAHVLQLAAGLARGAEPQVARADRVALRHQHGAFDGVIELPDVAGPCV